MQQAAAAVLWFGQQQWALGCSAFQGYACHLQLGGHVTALQCLAAAAQGMLPCGFSGPGRPDALWGPEQASLAAKRRRLAEARFLCCLAYFAQLRMVVSSDLDALAAADFCHC